MTCWVGPEAVTVTVRDRGPGFDDTRLQEILEERVRSRTFGPGGFGIMVARALSDEFFYNGRGNEVTLVKRFGTDSPA